MLTLLVLPILYRLAHHPDEEMEDVTAETGTCRLWPLRRIHKRVFRSDS